MYLATSDRDADEVGVGRQRLRVDAARVFTEDQTHFPRIRRSHDKLARKTRVSPQSTSTHREPPTLAATALRILIFR
jgi:hypothetical protein